MRRVWECQGQLITLEKEYEKIDKDIISLSSMDYSVPRVSGGQGVDTADKISKLMDAKRKVMAQWDAWLYLREEARGYFQQIDNGEERSILIERYINHEMWKDIADAHRYSEGRIYQLYRNAVQSFEHIFENV